MNKVMLIGCGAILGVVGVCGGFIFLFFYLTSDAASAANHFLTLLGEGKTAEAYQSASAGFRAAQNENQFTAAVKQLGLDNYASSSWS